MPNLTIRADQGLVTSRDPADLQAGELQKATGIEYLSGDPRRPWKVRGRSEFGAVGTASEVFGLALCQFDSGGSDKLIAYSGSAYYGATPGVSGAFSSLVSGLNASGDKFSAAHSLDRWYLCNGYDINRCLEADGTVRQMGMIAPQEVPSVVTSAPSETTNRPTATVSNTGWINPGDAWDAYADSFAGATLAAAGTSEAVFGTFASNTDADRLLYIAWALAGLPIADESIPTVPEDDGGGAGGIGIGGGLDSGYDVTVTISYSDDGGTTWTDLISRQATSAITASTIQTPISVDSNLVRVKCSITYTDGTSTATMRISDVRIASGSVTTPFDTVTGMYYGVAEWDENSGLPSPISEISALVEMTLDNIATVTLPSSTQNSNTTHYKIYRTPDEGTAPNQLGLIGTVLSTESTYVDDFVESPSTIQTYPLIPMVQITHQGRSIYIPRDTPPPLMKTITAWDGSLCGISAVNKRAYVYSEAGRPESWPEINIISSFPLPERDELVGDTPVGDTLLIGAKGVMITMNMLPRVISGVFNASEAEVLDGQPGLVGQNAITSYSVAGEPMAAWVSPFGIHVTNGTMSARISSDLDWSALISGATMEDAALHWNPENMQLIFSVGDWHYLIHMDPMQQKKNGMPKITRKPGKSTMFASGLVADTHRVYSAHASDGSVYLENDGNIDESEAYSGTEVPLDVKTGKIYGDWSDWAAIRGNLRHTDAGTGQEATLTWTMGRDSSGSEQVVTKTVGLSGHKGTDFFINRAGEWAEIELEHTGAARFGILDMRVKVEEMGDSGRVAV